MMTNNIQGWFDIYNGIGARIRKVFASISYLVLPFMESIPMLSKNIISISSLIIHEVNERLV